MSYVRVIDGRNFVFFAIDQWIFERDVDRGFLGEALARFLIFPYTGLVNSNYLWLQEVILKKRLVLELLENIVVSYPEFSYSMRIKPEYFMYEVILSRIRIFPPMAYGAHSFLNGDVNKDKVALVLRGYNEALKQLEKEGFIQYQNGDITMYPTFVDASKNPKVRFTNIIKNAPRALFSSLFGIFPQMLNFLSQNADAFLRFQMLPWRNEFDFEKSFVNPQRYIFVPTTQGLVSLADKVDIRGYVQRVLSANYDKIEVKEFGGVLNDVYLIQARNSHSEKKVLVKRFKDLSGFKWFPLSMWSIGARSFALMGKSRLERECAINGFLSSQGFNVPQIFHVSANERLVFMEFLEGENLSSAIKRIAKANDNSIIDPELNLILQVGKSYAKVGRSRISLLHRALPPAQRRTQSRSHSQRLHSWLFIGWRQPRDNKGCSSTKIHTCIQHIHLTRNTSRNGVNLSKNRSKQQKTVPINHNHKRENSSLPFSFCLRAVFILP
jgi:hypothetical protein